MNFKISNAFKQLLTFMRPAELSEPIVKKDLDYFAGIESEETNPDRLLNDTGRDVRLYDLMLMDDRIRFSVNLKKKLILSSGADIVAASKDPQAELMAAEVAEMIGLRESSKYKHKKGFSFWGSLDNALDAMVYGYKVAEKCFDYSADGKMFLSALKFRHSVLFSFAYDEFGDLKALLVGKNIGTQQRIEGDVLEEKFSIFTYPHVIDGSFYGQSDLMATYEPWRAKRHISRSRNSFLEKWGMPIPEALYDVDTTTAAEIDTLRDILKNFTEKTYLLSPATRSEGNNGAAGDLVGKFKFNIHERSGGTGTDAYEKAISQLDAQITRSFLIPDKLGFTDSSSGSFSLGEVQFDILKDMIASAHDWLEGYIDEIIVQLVDLNFGKQEVYPHFEFNDMTTIAPELLKLLIETKVIDKKEKWIRKYTSIPTISKEEQDEIDAENSKAIPVAPVPAAMPEDSAEDDEEGGSPQPAKEPQPAPEDTAEGNLKRMKDYRNQQGNPFQFKQTAAWYEKQEELFAAQYELLHKNASEALVSQIQKKDIVDKKDYAALETLRIPKSELKLLLTSSFVKWFVEGRIGAIAETIKRKPEVKKLIGVQKFAAEIEVEWLDREYIRKALEKYGDIGALSSEDLAYLKNIKSQGFYITGMEEERLVKLAKTMIDEGIKTGKTTASVISAIRTTLAEDRLKYATTIARTNISTYFNTGRQNFFTGDTAAKYVEAFQYQAILDDQTTDYCAEHDGQIIAASDPQLSVITPPNHFNCRSTLVPILVGDNEDPDSFFYGYSEAYEDFGANVTKTKPADGFGGS